MRSQELQGYHLNISCPLLSLLILHLSLSPIHSTSSFHNRTSVHPHLPLLKQQYLLSLLRSRISSTFKHKVDDHYQQKLPTISEQNLSELSKPQKFTTVFNHQEFPSLPVQKTIPTLPDHEKFPSYFTNQEFPTLYNHPKFPTLLKHPKFPTHLNNEKFPTILQQQKLPINSYSNYQEFPTLLNHQKFPTILNHQEFPTNLKTQKIPIYSNHQDGDGGQTSTEDEMEGWQLDEEPVISSSNSKSQKSVAGKANYNMGGAWWRVLSSDDPAEGAEPTKWDGDGALEGDFKYNWQDYEVLQDEWMEEAIM